MLGFVTAIAPGVSVWSGSETVPTGAAELVDGDEVADGVAEGVGVLAGAAALEEK